MGSRSGASLKPAEVDNGVPVLVERVVFQNGCLRLPLDFETVLSSKWLSQIIPSLERDAISRAIEFIAGDYKQDPSKRDVFNRNIVAVFSESVLNEEAIRLRRKICFSPEGRALFEACINAVNVDSDNSATTKGTALVLAVCAHIGSGTRTSSGSRFGSVELSASASSHKAAHTQKPSPPPPKPDVKDKKPSSLPSKRGTSETVLEDSSAEEFEGSSSPLF